ncbi:MAG TPA: SURF2 Surfeit locus protein 2 [Adlercreutzia equolifaciens]|uniref:SURF2 Surfeit locus protein 2 n=1 Tax=Adlercreutzia equolifaciens TaxID=446660 RepID=UPI0024325D22|nr:SURF2 Surfeit locus protein 2 [Adlercreutzia equolifaciens]HJI11986.1 SURF2 Surfeit locus protein 2 [Adlercreutzia equolifaciens]
MANPQEFSHITVTADEDDVVIQAGAVEEAVVEEAPAAEVDDAREEDPESAPEDVSSASGRNAEVPASSEAASASETTPTTPTAREKADAASFRETTLDDLESPRMSTTQKAIIVVAVLGVIAFAAWYLLAH